MFKKIDDVLEVAVRIERGGVSFYNRMGDGLKSPQARDVFSFLAAEEEKHAGTFGKMLEKTAEYTPRYDYPGEYGKFLDLMAESMVRKIENQVKKTGIQSDAEAIEAGIEFEKETILFYGELMENPDLPEKDILKNIIAEEKLHWRKLEALRGNLKF